LSQFVLFQLRILEAFVAKVSLQHKDAYYQILVNEGASQVQAAMAEAGVEEKLHSFGGLYMCLPTTKGVHSPVSHLSTIVALIETRSSLVTRALAFQAASRVNNIAADYTHLTGMKSVMKGGIYVYSQLNANRKSINLAFMLSPFNEVL
jgi:acid phosphatase family membrane protein YuiD